MEDYIGFIKMFAGKTAPRDWALCQGQILSVRQYPALYSIIGNMYGGTPNSTFALPDLQGRAPIGFTDIYPMGAKTGNVVQTLRYKNLPTHQHSISATPLSGHLSIKVSDNEGSAEGGKNRAISHKPGMLEDQTPLFFENQTEFADGNALTPETVNIDELNIAQGDTLPSGSNGIASFDINNPYIGINYIICLDGNFPPKQ